MLQETSDNGKRSSRNDLILCVVLVLFIIFAKLISDAVRSLPSPYAGIGQLAIFLGIVGLCYLIYRKVLCSYRYTLIYAAPSEDDLDAFGKPKVWPHPLGSLTIERMVGDKGKLYAQIQPQEYKAILAPGILAKEDAKKQCFTVLAKKSAHQLLYVQDGKTYLAYFSPSPEMAEKLSGVMESLQVSE